MSDRCPTPGMDPRAPAYVLGELRGDEATAFEDHLAGCAICAGRVTALDRGMERLSRVEPREPALWRHRLWAGAALAAIAAAALVFLPRPGHEPGPGPATNPPAASGPWRSQAETWELIEPNGTIAEAPGLLRWRGGDARASCTAEIVEADLTPVWASPVSGAETVLDEGARRRLEPGRDYLWRVRCGAGGDETGSSYVAFRIAPTAR